MPSCTRLAWMRLRSLSLAVYLPIPLSLSIYISIYLYLSPSPSMSSRIVAGDCARNAFSCFMLRFGKYQTIIPLVHYIICRFVIHVSIIFTFILSCSIIYLAVPELWLPVGNQISSHWKKAILRQNFASIYLTDAKQKQACAYDNFPSIHGCMYIL